MRLALLLLALFVPRLANAGCETILATDPTKVSKTGDTMTGTLTGTSFVGPLTGNVTGNVTGNISGATGLFSTSVGAGVSAVVSSAAAQVGGNISASGRVEASSLTITASGHGGIEWESGANDLGIASKGGANIYVDIDNDDGEGFYVGANARTYALSSTIIEANLTSAFFPGVVEADSMTVTASGATVPYGVTTTTGMYMGGGQLRLASGSAGIVFPDGTRQVTAAGAAASVVVTTTRTIPLVTSVTQTSYIVAMDTLTVTIPAGFKSVKVILGINGEHDQNFRTACAMVNINSSLASPYSWSTKPSMRCVREQSNAAATDDTLHIVGEFDVTSSVSAGSTTFSLHLKVSGGTFIVPSNAGTSDDMSFWGVEIISH